ncbi:hypothetical protein TREPR_1073 [Treponema primitia ZAS-2]|uniref:Uncharacterized protein n=1 Tax=Treponema primitia (strain ATCC BAA-887 / DSM 12427 / ZAS-2) TaxID=545694 RepID=F5YHC8_TREPZ|nr:hypothetical protein TREPR_1073 [Treponema primitia ZAS-2]
MPSAFPERRSLSNSRYLYKFPKFSFLFSPIPGFLISLYPGLFRGFFNFFDNGGL